jgi:uncharacterized ParB-like nuclease family protein
VINNALSINTRRITRYGDFRQVTARGKAVMRQAMTEHGVLTLERLLVQELPPNERVLNDGQPEYVVIDGNHRLTTCREMFPDREFEWSCDVVRVRCL